MGSGSPTGADIIAAIDPRKGSRWEPFTVKLQHEEVELLIDALCALEEAVPEKRKDIRRLTRALEATAADMWRYLP